MQSGFYFVQTASGLISCSLRGRLKQGRVSEDRIAVGDYVDIAVIRKHYGVIEKIYPRQRALVRSAPTARGVYKQVLLANLDLVVLVFACVDPEPHLRMLDRFLVITEKQRIPALIIANKVDLLGELQARKMFALYEPLGYQLLLTSAKNGLGIGEFRKILEGKIAALFGPSGAGKTSLLNAVQPELGIKVREVSRSTTKGRHSTVVRQLFPIGKKGYLADLPGLRALSLWDVTVDELDGYFPELRGLVSACQFNNCSHRDEPGCAVKAALNSGEVSLERYQSYLNMRAGIKETDW